MNQLTYQGYTAMIEFDERDEILVGRVLGIEDRISFHGEGAPELEAAFRAALDHYLVDCAAQGRSSGDPACV